MSEAIKFPDRGKAARESIGARLEIATGKGKRRHIARVYQATYHSRAHGDIPGAHMETDCGLHLGFHPFDGRMREAVKDEAVEFRETKDGDLCIRCVRSIGAAMLGYSRKRIWRGARPRLPKAKHAATTIQAVRDRREQARRDELFSEALFGVPHSEVKRRGLVKEGKGKGAKYRLGDYDGSDNPAA